MHVKSVLGLMVMVMFTLTIAGTAQSAVVEKTKMKGTQTATVFSASKSVRCANGTHAPVTATGFLSGATQISKATGSQPMISDGIFVEVDSYSNGCTGASIGFADGAIANGYTPPDRNLTSAALDGTTTVQDFDTGNSVSVTLAIDVHGTGALTSSPSSSITRTVDGPGGPITITINRATSNTRAGTATGTITIDGVTLSPTFSSTTLSFNQSLQITIEK